MAGPGNGEAEYHAALQVLGDVAMRHPETRVGDVECPRFGRQMAGLAGDHRGVHYLRPAEGMVCDHVSCAAPDRPTLDIRTCRRIFDQPIADVWASGHFGSPPTYRPSVLDGLAADDLGVRGHPSGSISSAECERQSPRVAPVCGVTHLYRGEVVAVGSVDVVPDEQLVGCHAA